MYKTQEVSPLDHSTSSHPDFLKPFIGRYLKKYLHVKISLEEQFQILYHILYSILLQNGILRKSNVVSNNLSTSSGGILSLIMLFDLIGSSKSDEFDLLNNLVEKVSSRLFFLWGIKQNYIDDDNQHINIDPIIRNIWIGQWLYGALVEQYQYRLWRHLRSSAGIYFMQ